MTWVTRFPRASIGILGVLLIVSGATALGFLNLRNLQRLDAIHGRVEDLERLRELRRRLEISLLDEVREAVPSGSFLAEDIRLQVENALALGDRLDPETARDLLRIESLLSRPGLVNREVLTNALELAGTLSERETRSQEDLLRQVREDGRRELAVGVAVLVALVCLATLAAWFLPRRLLDPLSHLRTQFSDLGAGRFEEISLEGVDAALVPLFRNYNTMVRRLAVLEEERRARADTLEGEVKASARALLDQQRALGDAERLAAVGETAAGMAHELRNPLAGILAAMENLQRDLDDPSVRNRLGVLHLETERVVRLLNDYLMASRHAPEPAVDTDLGELVRELLSLLRYQAPANIRLEEEIPEGLRCLIPPGRIRQTLLNLVGNALEALGSSQGTVRVLASREAGVLTLEVRDDGPGFPEELLPLAGQSFRTGRATGTGLGLATVHRTVRDLGGSMSIRNLAPRGASVALVLPCRQPKEH